MFLISDLALKPISHSRPQHLIPFSEATSALNWKAARPESLPDLQRHWHPQSEAYAGVDALFTALDRGWRIAGKIRRDERFLSEARSVIIFHFELKRADEWIQMPVLSNPCLLRLLEKQAVIVLGN